MMATKLQELEDMGASYRLPFGRSHWDWPP